MFYSTQILARRGPLGLVWMAAHMHEQLKRSQVSGMSLVVAADALLHPETPLALRLSGQLLLGLVRLYSKQLGYLHQDCQDALVRLQLAFREACRAGATGMHTLPAPPSQPGPPSNDLPLDMDASWGLMVDMMEAQMLQDRPRLMLSESWQLHDPWSAADFDTAPRISLPTAASPHPHSARKTPGRRPRQEADTQPGRDQTFRHHSVSQTPAASRPVSQAESLFAAVATTGAAHTARQQGGSQVPGLGLLDQDEIFADIQGDEDPGVDLLHGVEVEVEVLRDAPSSAAQRRLQGAQVLQELAEADSSTRRYLQQNPANQAILATDSVSKGTAHSRPSMSARQNSQGLLQRLEDATAGTDADSPASGLLDPHVDLAELMGMDLGPVMAGSVMQSPAHVRLGPASVAAAGAGELGGTGSQGMQPSQVRTLAGVRASSRLQQQAATTKPPQVEFSGAPWQTRKPPRHRAAAQQQHSGVNTSAMSHQWRVGGVQGMLPRRSVSTDTAVGSARRVSGDATLLSASECRSQLAETRLLQTERGLAAYRQSKRRHVMGDVLGAPQLLETQLRKPALSAQWGPTLMCAVQQCQNMCLTGPIDIAVPGHSSPLISQQGCAAATKADAAHMGDDQAEPTPPQLMPLPQPSNEAVQLQQAPTADARSGAGPLRQTPVQSTSEHDNDYDAENLQPNAPSATHYACQHAVSCAPSPGPAPARQQPTSLAAAASQHAPATTSTPVHAAMASPLGALGLGSQLRGNRRTLAACATQPTLPPFPQTAGRLSPTLTPDIPQAAGASVGGWDLSQDRPGLLSVWRSGGSGQRSDTQWEQRAAETLLHATQLATATLPPDVHSQLLAPPSTLGMLSPSHSQAAQDPAYHLPNLSQPVSCSQHLINTIATTCQPVPLTQIIQCQQSQPSQGPASRLAAARCFYDALILQSHGLVRLSQTTEIEDPQCSVMVHVTPLGWTQSQGGQTQAQAMAITM